MGQFDESDLQPEPPDPIDLIWRFATCKNFPRTEEYALRILAQALAGAAKKYSLDIRDVVERCIEVSEYCPTEHDLREVAREIHEEQQRAVEAKRNQIREWEKQYGKPEPFKVGECLHCGRKWSEITSTHRAKESEMWAKLRAHFGVGIVGGKSWDQISWARIYEAQEKLGYPLTKEQRRLMHAGT